MDAATRAFVRYRADEQWEYCHLNQRHSEIRHHIEHIVAKQHGGSDAPDNLALSCQRCNLHKGPNLRGIDPETGEWTRLFHPRRDSWAEHFVMKGGRVEGISAIGRTTVEVLSMNDARRVDMRREALLQ